MSEACMKEVERAVSSAAQTGELLRVALKAKEIARQCGAPARLIADMLTEAGIRAGVTMQFGAPD